MPVSDGAARWPRANRDVAVVDQLQQPLKQRLRLPALRLDMDFACPAFGVALLDKRAARCLLIVEIEAVAPIFGGEAGLFADPGNQRAHKPRRQQLVFERRLRIAAVVPFLAKLFFDCRVFARAGSRSGAIYSASMSSSPCR